MEDELKKLRLPALFEQVAYDSNLFMKARLRVCHAGRNLNGSTISFESLEKAQPSLANIPFLADVVFDENGEPQFGGHDFHIETDNNNNERIFYDEVPIGVIPESNNYAIEEYKGRHYVCCDCYIWREYSNYAADIFERDRETDVSMEIDIKSATYNSIYRNYEITDFVYKGVTCLGVGHEPGMAGANAELVTFAKDKTAFYEKMVSALEQDIAAHNDPTLPQEARNMDNEKVNPNFEDESAEGSDQAADNIETEETPTEPDNASEGNEEQTESEKAPAEDFSLMSNIRQQLEDALSAYTYEEADGFICREYWLEDFDTESQKAYLFSMKDWCYYSAPYQIKGDAVSLVPNFKKQVVCFRDFEGDESSSEVFTALKKDKERLTAKYDEALKTLDDLKAYQAQIELEKKQAAIAEITAKFEDLNGNEEFEDLKAKSAEYEISEFEKECYAIRGKYVPTKFSSSGPAQGNVYSALPNPSVPKPGTLEEITSRYLKN